MTPTDRMLLDCIGAGDQAALAQLYHTYRPKLWRCLWPQLDGEAGLTEEALHSIEPVHNEQPAGVWLRIITGFTQTAPDKYQGTGEDLLRFALG